MPQFFSFSDDQIDRLQRTNWGHPSTNLFAQEVIAALLAMSENPANQTNPGRGGFLPEDIIGITPPAGSLPTAFPIAAFAVVTAFLTFETYSCDIYLVNPTVAGALPITNMTVTQFDIDSLEVIPNGAGIPCLLHVESRLSGTKLEIVSASMQMPVYLVIP